MPLSSKDKELLVEFKKMAENGDFEKKTIEESKVKKCKNNGSYNLYSLPIVRKLTEDEKNVQK